MWVALEGSVPSILSKSGAEKTWGLEVADGVSGGSAEMEEGGIKNEGVPRFADASESNQGLGGESWEYVVQDDFIWGRVFIVILYLFQIGNLECVGSKKKKREGYNMESSKWHVEERSCIESGSPEIEDVPETGPLSIIVLGASGDLAKKKTFPALFNLYRQGFLPSDQVQIYGYARTKISDDELRDRLRSYLVHDNGASPEQLDDLSKFLQLIKYVSGSYDSEDGFCLLDKDISEHESKKKSAEDSSRRLFYLALPPSVYPSAYNIVLICCICFLFLAGGWTRIVVEKPFGRDLESAEQLSAQIAELFDEPQIYRIDHYLGKELVQNMLVLRFANRFFLPCWNRDNIDNVQIVFRENFGTEGRGGYFDQYGIIRDIIQNHLLQVFCLVAMEKPISLKPEHIRDEKVKVLESVLPINDDDVVLGQYEGYRDDPTVPDHSNTPTFATVILRIHNERWEGVPFIIKAGKALNSRKADIRVQFKDVPGDIYKCSKKGRNELVIRLQPSEAIYMKLTVKKPGLEMSTEQSELDLSYRQRYQGVTIPEAYERLILDTIRGDQQHFVRRDELKASWEIFTPLLHRIENGELKPIPYKPGSRGPTEADELLKEAGYDQTHGYTWNPPSS
ncbi:glucose-6-phosphate 1-dehydrogenase, cytoplasmic isoform [Senna tora]|uniref:Glucose-6-phosphate 1-dehydrogenase n=1 Tax=Senna tora TaxID=362788 RepID=A0A834SDT1_9FABA|nr:glucose-6-phosphate 1-dehydrogenase, cytoplasmic isoform [Senna tora]